MERVTVDYNGERITLEVPDGTSEADIKAFLDTQTAPEPPLEHDFDALQMIKNIPGSAAGVAKDVASAVFNPIDTTVAMARTGASTGAVAGRKLKELTTGQEIPPGEGEELAGHVWEGIKGRYGGLEEIQRTLETDPAGVAYDLAAGGAGFSKKLRATEPTTIARKVPKAAIRKLSSKDTPARWYQSSAKFSTTMGRQKRAELINTALEKGYMPTIGGLRKVEDRIGVLESTLDDLITEAGVQGSRVPVSTIFTHLNDLRRTKGGFRIEGKQELAAIDKIAKNLHEQLKGKTHLTVAEMQRFKVDIYKHVNWDRKNPSAPMIKEDAYKAAGRGARESLEEAVPDIGAANKELGALYDLQRPLDQATSRLQNRNMISFSSPQNVTAGTLAGKAVSDVTGLPGGGVIGAGLTALLSGITNPKVKAKVAIALHKIQRGDTKWLEANHGQPEVAMAMTIWQRGMEEDEE